jgi:hypothetical protein
MLPVLAACFLVALQEKSLLPPPPAGWRTERLEFPLSFAPELDYRGHEDLLFAPGMFNPDSESYFSYALAWSLSGPDGTAVELDEAGLARFLETYFRGLCKAVSADRGLERDVSEVKASVERDGPRYRASVAMFDPFTTGAALDLVIELELYARPHATEVLGLASPIFLTAPIWDELHALHKAWLDARPAPVFLSLFFVAVDAETYAALVGSKFLRESFAVTEERTTVLADHSYTGLHLYGQHTYFQFLQPGTSMGAGLVLGFERANGIGDFGSQLAAEEGGTVSGPYWFHEGKAGEMPPLDIFAVKMPSTALTVLAMEGDPRFLTPWNSEMSLDRSLRRADVLDCYAAALDRSALHRTAPFVDVAEVEVAGGRAERDRLLMIARAAGWEIEKSGDACQAPQFRLVLRPTSDPAATARITRFDLALREALEHGPLELGKVLVKFNGRRASFALRP